MSHWSFMFILFMANMFVTSDHNTKYCGISQVASVDIPAKPPLRWAENDPDGRTPLESSSHRGFICERLAPLTKLCQRPGRRRWCAWRKLKNPASALTKQQFRHGFCRNPTPLFFISELSGDCQNSGQVRVCSMLKNLLDSNTYWICYPRIDMLMFFSVGLNLMIEWLPQHPTLSKMICARQRHICIYTSMYM